MKTPLSRLRAALSFLAGSITIYLLIITLHACGNVAVDTCPAAGAGGASSAAGPALDPEPCAEAHKSGTRLRVKYYRAADGAESFIGWFDTELGTDCFWATAGDGKTRCVPALAGAANASTYFSDASCTEKLAIAPQACPGGATPKFGVTSTTDACGILWRIYGIGAKTSADPFIITGGTCVASKTPKGYDLYAVGAEIPASAFVLGEVIIE